VALACGWGWIRYAAQEEAREDTTNIVPLLKPLTYLFSGEPRANDFRKMMHKERLRGSNVSTVIRVAATELSDSILDAEAI
jgi:hypothetical protein